MFKNGKRWKTLYILGGAVFVTLLCIGYHFNIMAHTRAHTTPSMTTCMGMKTEIDTGSSHKKDIFGIYRIIDRLKLNDNQGQLQGGTVTNISETSFPRENNAVSEKMIKLAVGQKQPSTNHVESTTSDVHMYTSGKFQSPNKILKNSNRISDITTVSSQRGRISTTTTWDWFTSTQHRTLPGYAISNSLCKEVCRTSYNPLSGYPPVTNNGKYADLVTTSAFRDLADYVVRWPFRHYNENHIYVPVDIKKVTQCLPKVPIIFIKGDPMHMEYFIQTILPSLKAYIAISGATDYPSFKNIDQRKILDDPRLVRWYGQNPTFKHPKFEGIPIGLNAYEHGGDVTMFQHLEKRGIFDRKTFCQVKSTNNTEKSLLVLNFNPGTHSRRSSLYNQFCGDTHNNKWVKCIKKINIELSTTEHMVRTDVYKILSCFPFWLSPRGNGLDCHRTWEAFYIGAIPILESSSLDEIYSDMKALIVPSFDNVTKDFLFHKLQELSKRSFNDEKLFRDYWWKKIEKVRADYMMKYNITEIERRRCWA